MSNLSRVLESASLGLCLGLAAGCAVDSEESIDPELDESYGRGGPPASPGRFDIMVRSRHNGGTGASDTVGIFPYERDLAVKGFDPDAGWLDGDRLGYACAWTFLEYEGELAARVFFHRISYAVVFDQAMNEGTLTWDGQPGTGAAQTDDNTACNEKYPAVPYQPLEGDPGPLPLITLSDASDGHTLEVRDYNKVVTGSGVQFEIAETTPELTKVVMYQDRLPVAVSYYESLSHAIRKTTNAD